MSQRITVVIPVQNEEKNIPLVFHALQNALSPISSLAWSVLFVDDGSTDQSLRVIRELGETDERVKYLELSRHFGKELATTAGLHHAEGEAVVMMDADMQHPPEVIVTFLEHWRAGADVVIGVREKNTDDFWLKRTGSQLFHTMMSAMSETRIVPRETDFRLIDRRVLNEFLRFTERNRMTRGLLNWLGFHRVLVPFRAGVRQNGKTSYGYAKLTKLAISSFVSNSLIPLKVAGYLGMFITCVSGLLGIFIFVNKYILDDPFHYHFTGLAVLIVFNLFLAGIMLSCLGLVALYVGNIHAEVVNRPMYVVRNKHL